MNKRVDSYIWSFYFQAIDSRYRACLIILSKCKRIKVFNCKITFNSRWKFLKRIDTCFSINNRFFHLWQLKLFMSTNTKVWHNISYFVSRNEAMLSSVLFISLTRSGATDLAIVWLESNWLNRLSLHGYPVFSGSEITSDWSLGFGFCKCYRMGGFHTRIIMYKLSILVGWIGINA